MALYKDGGATDRLSYTPERDMVERDGPIKEVKALGWGHGGISANEINPGRAADRRHKVAGNHEE